MPDSSHSQGKGPPKPGDQREARLAQALRANLRRRKTARTTTVAEIPAAALKQSDAD
jgi:hypothetical protein